MNGEDDGQRSTVVEIIEALQSQPEVLVVSAIASVIASTVFLVAVSWAISKAGRFQPPVVVLSVIVGLVAMVAILGAIIRPEVQALAVAAGSAVGALAGALGTAFTQRGERHPDPTEGVEEAGDGTPG